MIIQLDERNEKTAEAIQKIQKAAYQIEADLIGFQGIPQLNETVKKIQNSGEVFIGFMDKKLTGFISYKEQGATIDIHRLAVDPDHFRKGIAKELLAFLLKHFEGREFIVSTGAANKPARKLYESFGFIEEKDFQVAPDVYCTEYRKKNN